MKQQQKLKYFDEKNSGAMLSPFVYFCPQDNSTKAMYFSLKLHNM